MKEYGTCADCGTAVTDENLALLVGDNAQCLDCFEAAHDFILSSPDYRSYRDGA